MLKSDGSPRIRVQHANLVGDVIVLVIASLVSAPYQPMLAIAIAIVSLATWMTGSRALRHYHPANGRSWRSDAALTALQIVALLLVLFVLRRLLLSNPGEVSFLRYTAVAAPGIVWLRLVAIWSRRKVVPTENVVVLGIGPLGRHTGLDIVERSKKDGRCLVGYLRFSEEPEHQRLPAPIAGVVPGLAQLFAERVIDEVFVAGEFDSQRAEMQEAIRVCERFGIPFALPVAQFRFGRARPARADAVADGYVHYDVVPHKPVQRAIKRGMDIAASAIALLLLSPLLVGTAIAIKLTSRGPILFRQERVGLHGARFDMLKFRSMVVNAEELKKALFAQNEQTGPAFKMTKDPRVTAVGRWIRKFSIDELPQLVNVLRGEMTLVGPRPPIPSEVARYEAWQRRRLSVRPGLTCVWQVSGRNQISFEDWMYLDMQYIDHWSLAEDLALIAKTMPVVLSGRGAS